MVSAVKTGHFDEILNEFGHERDEQIARHGVQNHLPDGTGLNVRIFGEGLPYGFLADAARRYTDKRSVSEGTGEITYADILLEEVFEALAERDPERLRRELIQVGTVAAAWVEAIDSRK